MWMGSIRMDMAVGIIIGGAFTSIVSSLVEDIINPFLGIFGGMNFDNAALEYCWGCHIELRKVSDCRDEFPDHGFCCIYTGESVKYRCPHCTSILDAKAVEAFEKNLVIFICHSR